jgi:hypothetical protein
LRRYTWNETVATTAQNAHALHIENQKNVDDTLAAKNAADTAAEAGGFTLVHLSA